jgi:hypothetical protein
MDSRARRVVGAEPASAPISIFVIALTADTDGYLHHTASAL